MNTLTMQQDGDWVRLVGDSNRQFITFLHSLKPASTRKYDPTLGLWLVYWTKLPAVAHNARNYFHRVDWSSLPDEWQMFMVGAEAPAVASEPAPVRSPFAILFVTEDAPMEVVRAAYRALATVHHPDICGTTERMTEINAAYEAICVSRGS